MTVPCRFRNEYIYNVRVYAFWKSKAFVRFLTRSRNRNNSAAWKREIYHSYTPESHIGFWSSGYDGFWRATSFPRLIPRALSRDRSVYCYVAFMHEPSRFHCHEHMTNHARAGGRASCFRGGSRWRRKWRWGYWAKAEIDDTALSCWQCATFPPALESQITVSLVFLITRSLPKRFNGLFNSFTMCNSYSLHFQYYETRSFCNKLFCKNKMSTKKLSNTDKNLYLFYLLL